MAFMPGQLVHTNEILVLLGDNWFVERSAKQAAHIVDRRMKSKNLLWYCPFIVLKEIPIFNANTVGFVQMPHSTAYEIFFTEIYL